MKTLTRFLVELYRRDMVAVFNSIFPRPVFFSKDYWQKIKSGKVKDRQLLKELQERKVLADALDDKRLLDQVRGEALSSEGVSILYLVLTNACNFRCKYCFQKERHGREIGLPMTKEIAQKGIDLFVKDLDPREYLVQIQLYGGEPLLNWDVFVFSVGYIKKLIVEQKLPKTTKIIALINGSLLNNEKARFIKANGIEIGLSVDGPEDVTYANRMFTSGKSPYQAITKSMALLKKYRIPSMLSITVSPVNVARLPEIVSWSLTTGIKSIGFNPIGGDSYGYVAKKMRKEEYDKLLLANLIKAYQKAVKHGVYEDRIGRKVATFVKQGFIYSDCGAINSQLVVHPDGKIGYCHAARKYDVGSVFDSKFIMHDQGEIKAWREALPINRSACLHCPAISLCGYGCFHNVIEEKGDVSHMDRQFCAYTRKLMEVLVWELYKTG